MQFPCTQQEQGPIAKRTAFPYRRRAERTPRCGALADRRPRPARPDRPGPRPPRIAHARVRSVRPGVRRGRGPARAQRTDSAAPGSLAVAGWPVAGWLGAARALVGALWGLGLGFRVRVWREGAAARA